MLKRQTIWMSIFLAMLNADPMFKMCLNHHPIDITQSSYICCCRAAEYAAAKAKYRECLQHTPEDILVLSNLYASHLKLQEWKPAVSCAQI